MPRSRTMISQGTAKATLDDLPEERLTGWQAIVGTACILKVVLTAHAIHPLKRREQPVRLALLSLLGLCSVGFAHVLADAASALRLLVSSPGIRLFSP